ncbi:MAG TPA: hypothetical protein PK537_04595 [Candidatus Limiplasma sp.]|nr:hypothetical protein [Candidatus Limiplasma sp.]
MKKRAIQKILAFALSLCLMIGVAAIGFAQEVSVADFDAMVPVLDLVASAAICASDFPTVISDEESELDSTFITFFFTNGLQADASLNITQAMLSDVSQQEAYLKSIFSAQIPALDVITPPETTDDYIGFLPVYVEATDDGDYYLIGEIYRGTQAISQMSAADYNTLTWEDRAIFTLAADETAMNGYRIDGFSVGSELLMEQQLQDYTNSILVEYINSKLGFSVLYPSLFDQAYFTEDADGAGVALADGSASFTVKRSDNTAQIGLNEYATLIAEAQDNAVLNINETFQYATVLYSTADGSTVFSIYIVTEDYVYAAQLSYPTDQAMTYSMYTMYLENSFVVDSVSVG